ncbi:DUF7573 domain-containing protein [Salinirussus salinus]|uniref:DUF7573 domain-containing protein n=1 Tax=Salinirussus salinus TaxID=1198300 RepID=UPI00135919AE|nr:hypothetical protein [Salinirussus salinus]
MENRSLDDFLDGEGSESEPAEQAGPDATGEAKAEPETDGEADAHAESGADAEVDAESGADAESSADGDVRVEPAGVEPAATTYAAGEGECAACGGAVRERWRGEAGLVCPACKEW